MNADAGETLRLLQMHPGANPLAEMHTQEVMDKIRELEAEQERQRVQAEEEERQRVQEAKRQARLQRQKQRDENEEKLIRDSDRCFQQYKRWNIAPVDTVVRFSDGGTTSTIESWNHTGKIETVSEKIPVTKAQAVLLKIYFQNIHPPPETMDMQDWFPDGFQTQPAAAALGDVLLEKLERLQDICGVCLFKSRWSNVDSFSGFLDNISQWIDDITVGDDEENVLFTIDCEIAEEKECVQFVFDPPNYTEPFEMTDGACFPQDVFVTAFKASEEVLEDGVAWGSVSGHDDGVFLHAFHRTGDGAYIFTADRAWRIHLKDVNIHVLELDAPGAVRRKQITFSHPAQKKDRVLIFVADDAVSFVKWLQSRSMAIHFYGKDNDCVINISEDVAEAAAEGVAEGADEIEQGEIDDSAPQLPDEAEGAPEGVAQGEIDDSAPALPDQQNSVDEIEDHLD